MVAEQLIPKRDKNTDISSELAQGRNFRRRLMSCAEEAAKRFMNGEDLNDVLAEIAKKESFSQLQIQRLVEETNTIAFNKKYDTLRNVQDRRIEFNLANLADILSSMGSAAPPKIDNPNIEKGKPGVGEIQKEAHEKTAQAIYHEGLLGKIAGMQLQKEKERMYKEAKDLNREVESNIFKVANCLVMSERHHNNANQLFNTMLDKVSFEQVLIDGIIKKAEEITNVMKDTRRIYPSFVLSLSVEPHDKVASTLFGRNSLISKQANEFVETPKIQPVNGISDFQELIHIAQKIKDSQKQVNHLESKVHGG